MKAKMNSFNKTPFRLSVFAREYFSQSRKVAKNNLKGLRYE
jgi:hypothetical protein